MGLWKWDGGRSVVIELWNDGRGRTQRAVGLDNFEMMAGIICGLGGGGEAVPSGIGFQVLAGTLHRRTIMLIWVGVLNVAEALILILMAQVTEQSERRVENSKAPEAFAAVVEKSESWAAPPMDGGSMCDATLLIEE